MTYSDFSLDSSRSDPPRAASAATKKRKRKRNPKSSWKKRTLTKAERSSKSPTQGTRWVFTVPDYGPQDERRLRDIDCRCLIYGRLGVSGSAPRRLHGFIVFRSNQRLSTVKNQVGNLRAHVARAHGKSQKLARDCKDGGDYHEQGDIPGIDWKERTSAVSATSFDGGAINAAKRHAKDVVNDGIIATFLADGTDSNVGSPPVPSGPLLRDAVSALATSLTCGLCDGRLCRAVVAAQCGHAYCEDCLVNHAAFHSECPDPACRAPLVPSSRVGSGYSFARPNAQLRECVAILSEVEAAAATAARGGAGTEDGDDSNSDSDSNYGKSRRKRRRITRLHSPPSPLPTAKRLRSLSDRLQTALRCPICLHTLSDPSHFPCQHAHCRECTGEVLRRGSAGGLARCPQCNLKVSRRSPEDSVGLAGVVTAAEVLKEWLEGAGDEDGGAPEAQADKADMADKAEEEEDEEDEEDEGGKEEVESDRSKSSAEEASSLNGDESSPYSSMEREWEWAALNSKLRAELKTVETQFDAVSGAFRASELYNAALEGQVRAHRERADRREMEEKALRRRFDMVTRAFDVARTDLASCEEEVRRLRATLFLLTRGGATRGSGGPHNVVSPDGPMRYPTRYPMR